MTEALKNLLAGASSAMDIYPVTDYSQFIPKDDARQRMQKPWDRTGRNLQRAMDRFSNEQQEQE